ncbi:DUF2782 domain-containing protein [Uliginosibacterium sp. 31-16]|uniref:DUF2782 domain-containing protein n=1 Tax=Uliginosibacterium sp. 31-16 TaxID=3068315 RepID=UPI002740220E|nr:DUF2782 domain-containing protein [Uliginosibacterium sp. 31-16]MDP5238839.1 DUF2782 domain-containing protein [Uliginosibacterium sp. 31-16]
MKTQLRLILLASTLSLACSLATAQKREPLPEPPPAPPSALPDLGGVEPEVTIRNRGGDRYEEYRVNGQLYMIKITPRIGKPYYLVSKERGAGFERINDLDRARWIPQWVLFEW